MRSSIPCDMENMIIIPKSPMLCPAEILTLWKCTVMPHFVQYLRYLPLASQIQTLQKELNSSLRRTLRIYGHDIALLADVGILPLRHIQTSSYPSCVSASEPPMQASFLFICSVYGRRYGALMHLPSPSRAGLCRRWVALTQIAFPMTLKCQSLYAWLE